MKEYKKICFPEENSDISVKEGFFESVEKEEELQHLVLIATKPDIIKQAPLILELKKRSLPVIVGHTGQHHDWNLSGGLEKEFGIEPDFNLNINGNMYEKQSQIIFRLGAILERIRKKKKPLIPYVHGDTMTAFTGGIASFMNQYPPGHVEAGIRTLTPKKHLIEGVWKGLFDVDHFVAELRDKDNWDRGSIEPYPEQFDTRASAATASIHFAPVELNRENLINEGYRADRIFVTGNTVSDALRFAEDRVKESTIFEKYPVLEQGEAIRICVHRRANVSVLHRFKAIFETIERFLLEERPVLLISLGATEMAMDKFGFRKSLESLERKYKDFIYSPVWPYYTDVIAATKKLAAVVTDSGSMQEECNLLGVPCATVRFNSDRPETVLAGSNVIAPPVDSAVISKIVKHVIDNGSSMSKTERLYGTEVSAKIIDAVYKVYEKESLFCLEHQKLGFDKLDSWINGVTDW